MHTVHKTLRALTTAGIQRFAIRAQIMHKPCTKPSIRAQAKARPHK